MWWIILVAVAIAGYYFYRRNTVSVRMTREQLELTKKLVADEKQRISDKKLEIIDEAEKRGDTIPISSIFANVESNIDDTTDKDYVAEIRRIKQQLLDEYGENIPVNVAYKFITDYESEYGQLDDDR